MDHNAILAAWNARFLTDDVAMYLLDIHTVEELDQAWDTLLDQVDAELQISELEWDVQACLWRLP